MHVTCATCQQLPWLPHSLPRYAVGPARQDVMKDADKQSTAANMSPSDAPTFNMMRCHWHCSGALLLMPADGTPFDHNLDSLDAGQRAGADAENEEPVFGPAMLAAGDACGGAQPPDGALGPAFGSPVVPAMFPNGDAPLGSPAALPDADGAMQDGDAPAWFGPDDGDDMGGGADGGVGDAPAPDCPDLPGSPGAEDAAGAADEQPEAAAADAAPVPAPKPVADPYEPLDPHSVDPPASEKPFKMAVPKTPKCAFDLRVIQAPAIAWRCRFID